jgi:hypothetical protein
MESNEVLFENLDYGAYLINYEEGSVYQENVKYATADFNILHVRRVRLPDGKGNVIYLLTKTFEDCIKMINSKHFITPPSYRRIYYPWIYISTFMGRRYKIAVSGERATRKAMISDQTNLRPFATRTLPKTVENTFFCASDLYATAEPIMARFPIKRNYEEFFGEIVRHMRALTPEPMKDSTDKAWNNRVLIIDADAFAFKNGAALKDNATNPLFLFYLAYLRTRDMTKLHVDQDMMICSKNMFLKFNPAHLNQKNWAVFRRTLFRIMGSNMDDYIDELDEEEKKELELDTADHMVATIVKNTAEPYTRNVSTGTKVALTDAVEQKLKQKAKAALVLDKTIEQTKKEVSDSINQYQPHVSKAQEIFQANLQKTQAAAQKTQKERPTTTNTPAPTHVQRPTTRLSTNSIIHHNPTDPLDAKRKRLFRAVAAGYEPLGALTGRLVDDDEDEDYDKPDDATVAEFEDDVEDDIKEIMTQDKEVAAEVVDEIQDKTVPMKNPKTAPVNSARDKKLRDEQKKVVVKDSTIEQILQRDASNVPIETDDHSKVMHTTNQNMHKITFANFDKTYLNELYVKDLVSCFDMLKDKESPFYVTNIEIRDTTTSLDVKETWTVKLIDETGKKHTIKVDIPKFIDDRFMIFRGTKWIILKQNFYNPLVKDTPDTVIMTTNYNKVTIKRKATKSLSSVQRIFALIKKTGDSDMFRTGDSTRSNMKYISTLEYDELSRQLFKFSSGRCELFFSRDYIQQNLMDRIPPNYVKGNEFFIGHEGDQAIVINEDTGRDRNGRTIVEIIEQNLPTNYKAVYDKIKSPTQLMYAEAKMAGEFIPVITTLIVWEGLTNALKRMKINWRFDPSARRVPANTSGKKYIRFQDGVLEYESKTYAELIMNGLYKMHPENFKFEGFNDETAYADYIYSQWGTYGAINELKNFREFLVDPITKDVCKDMMLPDDPAGLLIHAVKLLSDNAYVSKASDKSYRVRSIEMIPAILYSCIAKQYAAYVKSGRRIPMSLNQNCVIQQLIAEKTVEAYSTLNPVIEVSKTHTISTKGYKGSNSDHSYDEEKRSYDPTAIGKIAISSSPDANVGVNRSLVVEPTLTNARGYRDPVDDPAELSDVNILSPVEMMTPGTARVDDPIRTAIACKQSSHVVPVEDAAPGLVSNGFDEAVQFHLSGDFVINAEEDGKVVGVDNETGFIVVQYKSGKTKAINTNPEIVKNSGGGFYMSNQLVPVYKKVGQTFKKDQVLAYHPKYFKYSDINGLRYSMGPITKVAFMSSYNTYEDAGIATQAFGDRMKTSIVYQEYGKFKRNNNILSMVKVGDHVNVGDVLIKFDTSVEEDELAKYLSKLSEDNADLLTEESRSDIKANHAGTVIDIKVYTLVTPEHLSPSLGKVVTDYWDHAKKKAKFLEQFDGSGTAMKAGYLLTDPTEPIKDRYNSIKGFKGIDVLVEIYIEHADTLGVGDKIALYSANKQIVSEVIPLGYEPYSEFRPDEEISVLTSPGTIARRMTSSVIAISAAAKVCIELKRKIAKDIKFR